MSGVVQRDTTLTRNEAAVWPMYGYDPGNSNGNPNGTTLGGSPQKEKSVEYRQVEPPDVGGPNEPPNPPAVDGTILYFLFEGDLIAYDYEQETELWQLQSDAGSVGQSTSDTAQKPATESGTVSNRLRHGPCLCEGEILVATEDTIYTIDQTTGDIIRECSLAVPPAGGALEGGIVRSGQFVYYVTGTLLFAVDRKRQAVAWRFAHDQILGRPLVGDDVMVVQGREHIYSLDPETGVVNWMRDRELAAGTFTPQLLVDGTVVGAVDDDILALDAASGDRRWRHSLNVRDETIGCPCHLCSADGRIFVVRLWHFAGNGSPGEYRLLSLSLADGTTQWQRDCSVSAPTDDPFVDPSDIGVCRPVVSGESVFVESGTIPGHVLTDGGFTTYDQAPYYTGTVGIGSGTLHVFDATTGDQRWRCPIDDRASSLVATSERVYLGVSGGTFHGFIDSQAKEAGDTEVYDDVEFCPVCGSDLDAYDEPGYCPDCGTEL